MNIQHSAPPAALAPVPHPGPPSALDPATSNSDVPPFIRNHVLQLSAEVAGLRRDSTAPPLSDQFAHWLTAQFVAIAKTAADAAENGCVDLKILRDLTVDAARLRRGDHGVEWIEVKRARLELDRRKFQRDRVGEFIKWSESRHVRDVLDSRATNAEKIEMLGREIFGDLWDA